MTTLPLDIERVVREVLAELAAAETADSPLSLRERVRVRGTGDDAAPRAAASVSNASPTDAPVSNGPHPVPLSQKERGDATLLLSQGERGEVVVTSRVVAMTELAGRLEAVRRVVVPAGAVVTPAVRDELYRRGVELVYLSATDARPTTTVRLVLMAMGTRFDVVSLAQAVRQEGVEVQQETLDCHIAATDQLAGELARPGTLGAMLTRHLAAALCLANRHPGVRAVLATDIAATAAATAAVGANLLVLDPSASTFFQMKQILNEFCRGGAHECPEVLKKRLG